MRNAVSRVARRLIKPLAYYARNPTHLLASETIAEAQGNRFYCRHENLIERCILEDGVWEAQETSLVRGCLRAGAIAFDIGANIGYFTLLMSAAVGAEGQVHAFEPTRYAAERLRRNLALNPKLPANITINQVGLLASPQVREEALEARFSGTIPSHSEPEQIRFTTIDTYVVEQALERVDFVKVDVDGYDAQVIRGAQQALWRHKPVLLVELCQRMLSSVGDDVDEYIDLLRGLGYSNAIVANSGERTSLERIRGNRDLRASSWNVLLTPS